MEKDLRKTASGIPIKPVYEEGPTLNEKPGEFPYTRGIQSDMYLGRLWTMRQYAGFSTAEESNKRYHYLLSRGTTGLSVAFDLPTQIGYDSDHPMSEGEVGKVGVAIDTIEDMETLFRGINLETVSTSMTINATAGTLLALYIAVAKKTGCSIEKISGTIQNDILKEYAARGTYIYPPKPSMRLITDIFDYCSKEVPKWNTISISGYHIREAGSTAVQELAFTLANGMAYLKAAMEAGLDINVFGQRLSFFFNAHNHFFEEIAKFRAARRMWAKITKELGATHPKAMMLRFHTQTGGSTLTAQQPLNNVSRVTIQAMAAVLGGTQSLHTNGYDEAISLPTEEAAKTALRTQQIIAFESGITDSVDPMAGCYLVEELTDEIEKLAWDYIHQINQMGGAVSAIESGYMQQEIGKAAYAAQQQIERKEMIIVGLNEFVEEEKEPANILKVDDHIRMNQMEKLKQFKSARDQKMVEQVLHQLRQQATDGGALMPLIIEAIEQKATLGEIANVFRDVFGEYRPAFA